MASGTLHLVAVPIGNPDDLGLRARDVLREVPLIAAEDTRHFATLARHHDIGGRVVSYHDHNEDSRAPELLARLEAGDDIALVTDAGTPLVSDPGYRLVRAAISAGVRVTSLPGPSAVTTALAASGLPPHPFRFLGFLPRTAPARREALGAIAADSATLVVFEAPRRLVATLRDALEALGDRPACVARNLTKPHERYDRGTLATLADEIAAEGEVRGETTIVIGGAPGGVEVDADAIADAEHLLAAGTSSRVVQAFLTRRRGLSRRDAYAVVLRARGKDG